MKRQPRNSKTRNYRSSTLSDYRMEVTEQRVPGNNLALRIIALLSIVRWYNILLTITAQYLSAFILLGGNRTVIPIMIGDMKLHAIVLASIFSIAGGFIINNFY